MCRVIVCSAGKGARTSRTTCSSIARPPNLGAGGRSPPRFAASAALGSNSCSRSSAGGVCARHALHPPGMDVVPASGAWRWSAAAMGLA
ncbi:hypothetical protein LIPSTDRAFT_149936 [Lipomyces starkeyi NRRL Y-11557]|uniref:Uncharacterized protein n=1 Tax=Lipomyces starkeyi NRRL Y-11557 TaxID=675824 RepID=A0A1E3Q124_LIPST|nr:hypothetical protein LIPSTDRAFT_149936 [Lipomyces starkeyi NRRL Y-11557]